MDQSLDVVSLDHMYERRLTIRGTTRKTESISCRHVGIHRHVIKTIYPVVCTETVATSVIPSCNIRSPWESRGR